MKVLAVFVLVAFVAVAQALSDSEKATLQGFYKDCVAETKVDETLIKKMREGETSDDAALKKYVHCMFRKIGFLDDKNEIVVEKIQAKAPNPEEAKTVIEKCKETKGADEFELSYNLYQCYRKSVVKVLQF